MDTPKAQKQKTINFEVGDLVRVKKGGQKLLFPPNKSAGIIVKKLSEVSYGKPIYQIVWQNDTKRESYETHENLEKYDEEK